MCQFSLPLVATRVSGSPQDIVVKQIIDACHVMFCECFHVFYSSGVLMCYAACQVLERLYPVSVIVKSKSIYVCMHVYGTVQKKFAPWS